MWRCFGIRHLLRCGAVGGKRIPPAAAQAPGTVTIVSITGNNPVTSAQVDRDPDTPGLQVDKGDEVRVTVRAHGLTAGRLAATRTISGGTAADLTITGLTSEFGIPSNTSPGKMTRGLQFSITRDGIPEPDETITVSITGVRILSATTPPGPWTVGTPNSVTFTIRQNDGYVAPVDPVDPGTPPVVTPGPAPAPGPGTDNPAARAERLDAPMGAVASNTASPPSTSASPAPATSKAKPPTNNAQLSPCANPPATSTWV